MKVYDIDGMKVVSVKELKKQISLLKVSIDRHPFGFLNKPKISRAISDFIFIEE